jgi:Mg2+/Co2+ transporter CorC
MKNKTTNNKNITTGIMLSKNLLKIITKKEILTIKKQMLLTSKEMTKIKSKKRMNKMMTHNRLNHPTPNLVSRMHLVL